MNNGEEAGEIISNFASPDPLDGYPSWEDQRLEPGNASPASTEFSSGESEFERYCSANSVMGTASLCSSVGTCNDFLDSDLGSFKSLRFDDFGSGGRSGRNSGDRSFRTLVNAASGVSAAEEGGTTIRIEDRSKLLLGDDNSANSKVVNGLESPLSSDTNSSSNKEFIGAEDNEDNESHSLPGSSNPPLKIVVCEDNCTEQAQSYLGSSHGLNSVSRDLFDGSETGSVLEGEEGNSSRYEHSEDEGSMFGNGTDDEQSVDLYHRRNLQFLQVPKTENEHPLLMNSALAFGADDWNDFEQENEGNSLVSTMWDKPQEQQEQPLVAERKLLDSVSVAHAGALTFVGAQEEENIRDKPAASSQVNGTNESVKDPKSFSIGNNLTIRDPLMQKAPTNINLNIRDGVAERELQGVGNEESLRLDGSGISSLENSMLQLDPLSDVTGSKLCSPATEELRGKEKSFGDHKPNALPIMVEDNLDISLKRVEKDSPMSTSLVDNHLAPIEVGNPGMNDCYDEFVLEMEEILLDSRESHGARFPQGNRTSLLQLPHPFRDGSSTASTSGTEDPYPLIHHQSKIDGVEVVGAKQMKGDVSLGERLVGVKEYTVYKLRVWSGSNQWEVERRYRDFYNLYYQLKRLFADHGWSLPSPWSRVEKESRKIFGNASPSVVSDRSVLIQDCLRSILHSGSLYSTPTCMICFLSPQNSASNSSTVNELVPSEFNKAMGRENVSSLGKTISLVVEIQPRKSIKQLLEAQHYTCAGCHKHLDAGKTLMQEFVQTFGWGNPRLCEYTGQLFCASCHTNDIAVLPARVLHLWDFSKYTVCQFAKSYLESTYDQPMLCVSAVNPFLFSKVPTLLHVMGIRKKIGAMLPYVRCPFRRSVNRGLGSRRYLLESNDFFALRDLVDLSKGAFAVLPVKLETVSMKILEHITQQCLVCCDAGVPCGARQACEDTSSLIFPFQEGEIDRCTSCNLVFHKPCFRKLTGCLCGGTSLEGVNNAYKTAQLKWKSNTEVDGSLDVSTRTPNSETTVGFLSSLFTRSRPDKTWGSRKNSPVILMGSLPSNSL